MVFIKALNRILEAPFIGKEEFSQEKCSPQNVQPGEAPNYICLSNGEKYYLSIEEKKDYIYGGKCPKICPIRAPNNCPDIKDTPDDVLARGKCEADPQCQFIGRQVLQRDGLNYCVPKQQEGCITLTERDLLNTDKTLTDRPDVCDRLGVGCIFHRGIDNPTTGRSGEPTCLRGCMGSKYWDNPDYVWGAGEKFKGSYIAPDLELGPIYLEAAPSSDNPFGWGGHHTRGGSGKLPLSLSLPYTESRGKLSPPCNINQGDIRAYVTAATGEMLAGPGCTLTRPQPQYGQREWSYTCGCGSLETRVDGHNPCPPKKLDRDVCKGCYIEDDKENPLHGHCVLGITKDDTESEILGCVPDINEPDKCRVRRQVQNTECPHFCTANPNDPTAWKEETRCRQQVEQGCWKVNPEHNKILSKTDVDKVPPPFLEVDLNKCTPWDKKKVEEGLCRNCAPTSVETEGIGTKHPNVSRCLVGGNASSFSLKNLNSNISRELVCPPTCSSCHSGFFGEPMKPVYNLKEAYKKSSVFHKGPIHIPWIGKSAEEELDVLKTKFDTKR